MREIKYRAYLKEEQRMVEVLDLHLSADMIGITNDSGTDVITYDFVDVELMQYTGLKDKNGKEIYHDDWFDFNDPFGGDRCQGYVDYCEGEYVIRV